MTQRGFTLLEAIVALVLIATIGMSLLNWINTNLITLGRVQQVLQRHEATRSALVFMDTVNPLEQPHGEQTVGVYKFNWKAQAVELPKTGVDSTGAAGFFEVGLYDTVIDVSLENTLIVRFALRQVGFRQTVTAPVEEETDEETPFKKKKP
jgi:general secretion pathway protein I